MIELRFVDRAIEFDLNTRMKTRVLQYRQVELRVDASGALTPLPNVTWSDWQDVPVVTEE